MILTFSFVVLPLMVFAHNPGGAIITYAISFILAIFLSLPVLRFIKRKITIENKYIKFFALLAFELGLLFLFSILLMSTLGYFVYVYCFGG